MQEEKFYSEGGKNTSVTIYQGARDGRTVATSNLCVEPGTTHIFRPGNNVATVTLEHRSRGIRFWLTPRTYVTWPTGFGPKREPTKQDPEELLFWLGPTTLRSSHLVECGVLTTLSKVVKLQWGHLGKDYKTVAKFEWRRDRKNGVVGQLAVSGDAKYDDCREAIFLTILVMLEREEARRR